MTQYIKKLPAAFQTVTETKFFDATLDQVFSKKDSDLLAGYLGRRTAGDYNPVTDFYLPEPSKNRTWWQLEATAYAQDASSNKTNIFFYEDLLDNIEYYGGNVLNQDRLFESEYYSFGPPIDYDMFINYQNYYWVEQGLATITITGVTGADIVGKSSFNTNSIPGATPANLTITTGLTISLIGDPVYSTPHVVENIGGCIGIRLVPQFPDYTPGTVFEFLPWDGAIQLSTGRIINNAYWDMNTWDSQTQPGAGDYITIERGSLDRNAWSRTNKWFNIDAITTTIAFASSSFPSNATRALRPIIQFIADLNLYKTGTQFRSEINYGFRDDTFGSPLLLADYQGQLATTVNAELGTDFIGGELVCFFNDATSILVNLFPWEIAPWDQAAWDAVAPSSINKYIFEVTVLPDGTMNFEPYTAWSTPILEGDIVFITEDGPFNSAQRGQTWYYSLGIWQEAFNDKVSINQPPLFQLYDHNGVGLDNSVTYPKSTFYGSKIFSYKLDATPGATIDPVLGFPIVYTALGQASDIIFQNNLITDRYVYSVTQLPINGYYYYKTTTDPILYNNWNLYQPCQCNNIVPPPPVNCLETSKQRVIDKFVVGYGTKYQFKLSVTPYGYVYGAGPIQPSADLSVNVNGTNIINQVGGYIFEEINKDVYVNLVAYITSLLTTQQSQAPVVEVQTYTHGLLNPDALGYFAIPQQLEANPNQLEVYEISGSDLTQHFASIIANQIGEIGIAFGGNTNYRDTRKNRSVGSYILQNVSPALKTMLVSSSDDLDFIAGARFSQDEYTKFKNKYLRTALQLINQEFDPVQYHNNTVVISAWVEEILKVVNISNEFSNAFAYSYMIANGSPYLNETNIVPVGGNLTLTNYIDLSDPKNALYIYDITGQERLLVIGEDYEITSINLEIDIKFNLANVSVGNTIICNLYKNPLPAYIPSTPSKIGAYSTYVPRMEWDTSYINPTWVIIGHDGSKTITYGDYRDQLLLELEKRIYNLIQYKFRHQYYLPLRVESVKAGYFRQTRYLRQEYLDVTESYINKWSAKNRANYRANDWYSASTDPAVVPSFVPGIGNIWKLYNYRYAVNVLAQPLNLPGNWKGIFQYYYDTIYPDTRPWEMLGFSEQPSWWVSQYGPGTLNMAGQTVWSSAHTFMWQDLEFGIIRQGPSAIYDPVTTLPQEQPMWARPGLSAIIPVNSAGEIISVMTLFGVAFSGNYYEPFDHFDADWMYGDGSPVEQAWMSTSAYTFNIQEFLFLMRPAPYGELFWDTVGTELSPGMITVIDSADPVMSDRNWQFVQNDTFTSSDPFFAWMRPKNADQIVHAETVDNVVQIRYGYQRWISDRILFLGKDIASTFGQKIRTLNVNLANKLAGFANKDTTNLYIESVSPNTTTSSLIIPSTNFEVILHQSPVVATYSYSGVIIRALADGTFAVYGYDLLNAEFITLGRSDATLIDVSIGGTPSPFLYFSSGATYNTGDIVRYNGVYYVSLVTQTVQSFVSANYQKLKSLPIIGGISVIYKPISTDTITKIPYGSILKSAQAVFDLLIGWGAYLGSQGWQFNDVNQDTNILNDWLYSAKQFLFWLNTNWAPDASIQLSPLANKASLIVSRGYPNDVESLSNGVYSILDKYGVAIPTNNTTTNRDGMLVTVEPSTLASGGIYYLQVNTSETEHIIILDNTTSFNDTVYSPLLRARQQRLRFNGFRSNGWYGKMEASGYLIIGNQLVPNFDTIVESMRYFYDPNVVIDNPSLEALGHHLIGYESKSYLDNLQVANNIQYLFYQGAIRQKGTTQAFDKLFRSTKVQSNEIIQVFEEWALKLGEFGNTIEQVSTEFILQPEQNTGEVVVARLNYIPSTIGFVKQISILNAVNTYVTVPKVIISAPDASPSDPNLTEALRQAKAYIVLSATGQISRVDITDPGYGYLQSPVISIDSSPTIFSIPDQLYSVWQGSIISDNVLDNIINIDIDQTDVWTVRPADPAYSLEFPVTPQINYSLPNAGYVNFNDITWTSFDVTQTAVNWGTASLNPGVNDTVWVAKNFIEDWSVYKMAEFTENWIVTKDNNDDLLLLTDYGVVSTLSVLVVQAGQATATAELIGTAILTVTPSNTGGYYYTIPSVSIFNTNGAAPTTLAEVTAILSEGSKGIITGYTVSVSGAGYTTPEVLIDAAPPALGSGAVLEPVVDRYGRIVSVNIIEAGIDYTVVNTVIAARAIPGSLSDIDATFSITTSVVGEILTVEVMNKPGNTHGLPVNSGYAPVANVTIIPELWNSVVGDRTDFGNMIVLQQVIDGTPVGSNNYTVGILPYTTTDYNDPGTYTDPDTLITYNAYYLTTLAGVNITSSDIGNYADFTDMLLYKTMRFPVTPDWGYPPSYIQYNDKIWVDDVDGKWNVLTWLFVYEWGILTPFRQQEPLINTSLFESASIFASDTRNELIQLPIYDPFKSILPGPAKQNIAYISEQDPASYNVTADATLFSENITFANRQVGQLWWDLSSTRYTYYEQPRSLKMENGTLVYDETALDNLVYRRNNWGQLFPGSIIAIYEWVQSSVPPALYTGTGTPRDITTYVQVTTSNRFTSATVTNYYFWVLNTTDKPNIENRTMAAQDVALMLQSPMSQGFAFFCPIQQTSTNNSYIFYNVQNILSYQGDNVQIQYRLAERNDQKHTQWAFFREGDPASIITDQFWNKMVDSLCGYSALLPATGESIDGIPTWTSLPWDSAGWDTSFWDNADYGVILPVPDPKLSEGEKYGIDYRPRQGMFVNLPSARQIFTQAANQLLVYIPIRDNNPGWGASIPTWNLTTSTDIYYGIYWTYTDWYAVGYENVTPNIVFQTLQNAKDALTAGLLKVEDIVEVSNGTTDGRWALYAVSQLNPNIPVLSLTLVGIESSAINLMNSIYTTTGVYSLSTELRALLNAFRLEVMVDAFIVDQNELFFSMMNYVMSEQKNPNWLFKSSYIYVKENNIPLTQTQLYVPDQITNILQFITDSKPYHTQIRDYTSTYLTTDIAAGTAIDSHKWNIQLQIGPDYPGLSYDTPSYILDAQTFIDNIDQFVSREDVYTVPLTFYDSSKVGYSALFPYTFNFNDINLSNPQNIVTPYNIVGIQIGTTVLLYGQDYYVGDNDNTTFTVYFYNDPGTSPTPVALVWFDGGQLLTMNSGTHKDEIARGFATDDLVINVDTRLPADISTGIPTAYVGWGDTWDSIANPIAQALVDAGGSASIPWDPVLVLEILPNTISSKENSNDRDGANFYRNAEIDSATLVYDLLAPQEPNENIEVITVLDINHVLPDPGADHGTIWIGGERIEYRVKELVATNTWELKLIQRGTMGTSATEHTVLIPSLADPMILVPNAVWVEKGNYIPGSPNIDVWNAVDTTPVGSDNITSVPMGGLWYAQTPEAMFLKQSQGISIP